MCYVVTGCGCSDVYCVVVGCDYNDVFWVVIGYGCK